MGWDDLLKTGLSLFTATPEDKDRVQQQLQPLLLRRTEPCIELWKQLWPFANGALPDLPALLAEVNGFLQNHALVISAQLLVALVGLKDELESLISINNPSMLSVICQPMRNHLFPYTDKDAKGKDTRHPGLLMLLRDELGSNSRSAASTIKP